MVRGKGGWGLVRVLAILGGVLEQTHGTDVVLSDVITRATPGGIPEVDGHSIHHKRYHACQILDKVAIKDLCSHLVHSGVAL